MPVNVTVKPSSFSPVRVRCEICRCGGSVRSRSLLPSPFSVPTAFSPVRVVLEVLRLHLLLHSFCWGYARICFVAVGGLISWLFLFLSFNLSVVLSVLFSSVLCWCCSELDWGTLNSLIPSSAPWWVQTAFSLSLASSVLVLWCGKLLGCYLRKINRDLDYFFLESKKFDFFFLIWRNKTRCGNRESLAIMSLAHPWRAQVLKYGYSNLI